MDMDAACESCALWRDHCYWDHKKPQFSVAASHDFKNSIHIPQKLSTHLRNRISDKINLSAPNGIMYDVVVNFEFGQAVLRSGWDAFANAHQIEENDTFLFKYYGDSKFEIHIFDSDGCEKKASCSQPPSENFGAFPPNVPCNHLVLNEQAAPNPGQVHMAVEYDYTMATGCHLTNEQDEKVVEIARTIRSEIPLYVAVMSKINVSKEDCFVNIPLRLVDHFKEETTDTNIKLVAPNCHIYTVGASKHSEDQIVLRSGWDAFVAANHIQKNDLLIFSSKGRTRLNVLTLDPSGCHKTSPCVAMKDFPNTAEDSVQITDPPPRTIETIDLTSSDDDHIVREDARRSPGRQKQVPGCGVKTRKMASTSTPHAQSGFNTHKLNGRAPEKFGVGQKAPMSKNIQGPSRPPYILAKGITLIWPLEKKVQEKVQEIGSEVPIYVAVLTKCCVGGNVLSMGFCKEYASAYLPSRDQTLTLQLENKEWRTTLHVRPRSIMLCTGWSKFVTDNDLRLGDVCLFAKRSTGSLAMRVYFVRK
uniref:Uncharacterized protein n=1 Tax=Avena sativa TaxID=4498 RepID=A0ACD5X697_AVESA